MVSKSASTILSQVFEVRASRAALTAGVRVQTGTISALATFAARIRVSAYRDRNMKTSGF
jgi:hypothetical protein